MRNLGSGNGVPNGVLEAITFIAMLVLVIMAFSR